MSGSIVLRNSNNMRLKDIVVIDGGEVEITNSRAINIKNIDAIRSLGTKIYSSQEVTISDGQTIDVHQPFTVRRSKNIKVSRIKASYTSTPKLKPLVYLIRMAIYGQ